jgi:sirohydrochlorin ferrochelatase
MFVPLPTRQSVSRRDCVVIRTRSTEAIPGDKSSILPLMPYAATYVHALLLIDHGSSKPASNRQLLDVCALVQSHCPGVIVVGAHMELAEPSIAQQVDALAAQGVTELVVVPYFLAPGRHAREDIPHLVQHAAKPYSQLRVNMGECLGVDDLIAQLVLKRALAAGLKLG